MALLYISKADRESSPDLCHAIDTLRLERGELLRRIKYFDNPLCVTDDAVKRREIISKEKQLTDIAEECQALHRRGKDATRRAARAAAALRPGVRRCPCWLLAVLRNGGWRLERAHVALGCRWLDPATFKAGIKFKPTQQASDRWLVGWSDTAVRLVCGVF